MACRAPQQHIFMHDNRDSHHRRNRAGHQWPSDRHSDSHGSSAQPCENECNAEVHATDAFVGADAAHSTATEQDRTAVSAGQSVAMESELPVAAPVEETPVDADGVTPVGESGLPVNGGSDDSAAPAAASEPAMDPAIEPGDSGAAVHGGSEVKQTADQETAADSDKSLSATAAQGEEQKAEMYLKQISAV